jgi:hypothetical protein
MGVQKLRNNKHAHHLIKELFNRIESEAWSAMVFGRVTTTVTSKPKQIDKQTPFGEWASMVRELSSNNKERLS